MHLKRDVPIKRLLYKDTARLIEQLSE